MDVQTTTAKDARNEFTQLLVTQLRHQDPLDPVKQEDFLAQLAQFSTLEGIEEMNVNVQQMNQNFAEQIAIQADILKLQQFSQAATMVGRNVAFETPEGATESGRVDSVSIRDGVTLLTVGDQSFPISRLTEMLADGATTPALSDNGPIN